MSILEGGRDHKLVYPIANPYGTRLPECARLALAGATDVVVDELGQTAYVAGRGTLSIVDVARPEQPALLAQLQGLGVGRQLEVQAGLAAVTTRPDGLFLCDVSDPTRPRLLCHYDTVELATGVCLSANLCLVACRHFGVEVIDISEPRHPVHLSNVLAGEAQSIFVDGTIMYVGAWMQREVQVFDLADPAAPRLLSICPLDGFADGIYVRDGLCYAATGHHARRLENRRKYLQYDFVTEQMLHEGYGGGHGLEIFDVTDPARPRLLSRLKTPPLFMGGNDLWDVVVSGRHAFLGDTYNGLFVINIDNPRGPYFVGYHRLDTLADANYHAEPSIQQLCQPVTGLAVIQDHVLITSPSLGLITVQAPDRVDVPPQPPAVRRTHLTSAPTPAEAVFHTGGQVHGLAFAQESLVVATGGDGLYLLADDDALTTKAQVPTEGVAFDIKADGELLYAAEGAAGLAVYRLSADRLLEVARWRPEGERGAVRQVVLLPDRALALLHLGVGEVAFIDISRPEKPTCVAVSAVGGMMYYKSLIEGLLAGRYAAAVPLSPGLVWYDLQDQQHPVRTVPGPEQQVCTVEEGLALGPQGAFCIFRGRYTYTADITSIPRESGGLTVRAEDGSGEVYLSGRPTLIEDTLYLLNRMNGLLTSLDVSDPKRPSLRQRVTLQGHPEAIALHNDALWVCCGHGGLQRLTR